jgi:exopolysaccharide biosynthesis protein
MAQENNALLAINGGGFVDYNYNSNGNMPIGITISNGKVITNSAYDSVGGTIGFTKDNVLVLLRGKTAQQALDMGIRDAVTMGPFLIVNGKASFVKGNGGWGYAARTAIGQRKDGIVLFLVVDSNETRSKGADMIDLTTIMQNYGAINAVNLDGGTSSVMVENGSLINDPIDSTLAHKTRPVASAFIVK